MFLPCLIGRKTINMVNLIIKKHFLKVFLFVKLIVSTLKLLLLTGVPCLRLQHYY